MTLALGDVDIWLFVLHMEKAKRGMGNKHSRVG